MNFIKILDERGVWDEQSWRFAFYYKDLDRIIEYLNNDKGKELLIGKGIKHYQNKFLSIDILQLFEYHPLLSNRVHNFMNAKKTKILNLEFKKTYSEFLNYLVEVNSPRSTHYLTWCYYLLLQERIEESIEIY